MPKSPKVQSTSAAPYDKTKCVKILPRSNERQRFELSDQGTVVVQFLQESVSPIEWANPFAANLQRLKEVHYKNRALSIQLVSIARALKRHHCAVYDARDDHRGQLKKVDFVVICETASLMPDDPSFPPGRAWVTPLYSEFVDGLSRGNASHIHHYRNPLKINHDQDSRLDISWEARGEVFREKELRQLVSGEAVKTRSSGFRKIEDEISYAIPVDLFLSQLL